MRSASWLDGLKPASPSRRARRAAPPAPPPKPPGRKLSVELLDDRILPSFATPVNYAAGDNPQAVVTGDFNGDGKLDLAVANYYGSTVSVLRGNGYGTFQPALSSATGSYPLSLAVGDFNGDGKADVATANSYDVSVLLGNGDGTFGAPAGIGIGSNHWTSAPCRASPPRSSTPPAITPRRW